MKRLLAYGAALALALTVGPIVPGAPAPTAAAEGKVLVGQAVTMTGAHRIVSTQPPADRRIDRAVVEVGVTGRPGNYTYRPTADVTLAEPPSSGGMLLLLGFGYRSGERCMVDSWVGNRMVTSAIDEYFITPDDFPRPSRPWECATVALTDASADPVVIHDQVAANLRNTYLAPNLMVGKVALLGQTPKQLRLVRGVPTIVEVTVRNRGKAGAGRVRVTGQGQGVKVGAARSATALTPGRVTTVRVPIRLNAAKARKVRLTVQGGGVKAHRVIVVRPVKAPARPLAGTYRSNNGRVTFAVRNGRVVNWRGTMRTRCGVAPSPYTYQQETHSFPGRKVARSGIVDAVAKGRNHTSTLRLRVVRGQVRRGLFTYSGPGVCTASVAFNATRVGR